MMRVSSAALLVAAVVGCDDRLPDAFTFATRAAAIACEAVFRCCSPDFAMHFGDNYFDSRDEPTCKQTLDSQLREELRVYLSSPTVRFDRAAAQRCLDAAQATVQSCDAIYGITFQLGVGAAYSCPGMLTPTLREGDACDGPDAIGCGECTACRHENGHGVCRRIGPSPNPSPCPNQTPLVDPGARATTRTVVCTPQNPELSLNSDHCVTAAQCGGFGTCVGDSCAFPATDCPSGYRFDSYRVDSSLLHGELCAMNLYVFGDNYDIQGTLADAAGSLGAFSVVPNNNYLGPGYTSDVIGKYVYLIGDVDTANGFTPGIIRARINDDKTIGDFAEVPGVELNPRRAGHTSAVVGNSLYIIGGYPCTEPFVGPCLASSPASVPTNSIERASISDDGSVGAFSPVTGIALTTPRQGHTSAVIGNYLYVIGGDGGNKKLNTVERASINPDGSLGAFATVPNVTVVTPRSDHTSAIIGNYLYLIGGVGDLVVGSWSLLDSVERAAVSAGGANIGSFETVSGVTLTAPRAYHASTAVQDFLYVIGGETFGDAVERAAIGPGGSLGTFTSVPSLMLSRQSDHNKSIFLGLPR
jgi:hypothetical protein